MLEGSYKVKLLGSVYLPLAAPDQSATAYEVYKDEVSFYPATERTLNGLKGMVLSKPAVMDGVPQNVLKLLPELSDEGDSWSDIVEWVVAETLSLTYGGIMIDRPEGEAASAQEEEDLGLEPYVAKFTAENILDVQRGFNVLRNRKMLSFVKLKVDDRTQRVLKIENGIYVTEIWRDEGFGYRLEKRSVPLRGGKPINRIPFIILGRDGGSIEPKKPLLEDVAALNVEHYRIEGRITYIHYWMSMAILWASGIDDPTPEQIKSAHNQLTDEDGNPIETAIDAVNNAVAAGFKIGGPDAWILSNPQGKVDYAEFKGTGVQSLERKRDKIEDRLAKVGQQVLGSEKKDAEAVETVQMRRQAEMAALASAARAMSRKLTDVLQWLEWWQGGDDKALKSAFSLNTDYRVADISPQLLTALAGDNQRGELASETYFTLRQSAGLLPEALTWEEELERREADALRVPVNDFDADPTDDEDDDAE